MGYRGRVNEKTPHGFVNQRRVRPPAKRITVHDGSVVHQPSRIFDSLNQVLIRGLDVLPRERRRHRGDEQPVHVNRVRQHPGFLHDPVRQAHAVIVRAIRGSLVHHARAAVVRDVGIHADAESGVLHLLLEEGKNRFVP